jgi:hypothetical protein
VNVLVVILALLLLAVVFLVVSAPLRGARRRRETSPSTPDPPPAQSGPRGEHERDDLEAAREAKYREIRDAELDFRTGKLSREDYDAIDRVLRAEAIEILDRLEASGA